MVLTAGVDACKGGWIYIAEELPSGRIFSELFSCMRDLIENTPKHAVLGIDIPIGIPESGRRRCDRLARKMLGRPRSSSVFPAPIRPALTAENRKEADRITRSIDGRGVGAQAWNIYARIREVDEIVRKTTKIRNIIHEVHPEISFKMMNQGNTIQESKKTTEGKRTRESLIDEHFKSKDRESVRRKHALTMAFGRRHQRRFRRAVDSRKNIFPYRRINPRSPRL